MTERLAWMPNTKDSFTISHKYSDIKTQKISPEGKAKIQLQIVLHNGDNTTFQFFNLDDRTAVKDALLVILPQFKGKMSEDKEKKGLLLSKNPNLLQLYKDLVESRVISAEDFWSQFMDSRTTLDETQTQDIGVSADFLSGIPLNGKQIKMEINVETLWAIMKTYPKVAKKHEELVPTKMSETEFWNKFFQSRYFNRDRTKDIFSDCIKSDEKELKKESLNPQLDVEMFYDISQGIEESPAEEQQLFKRFNQISMRLLKSQAASLGPARREDWEDLAGGSETDVTRESISKMHDLDQGRYTVVTSGQATVSASAVNEHINHLSKHWTPNLTDCLQAEDATEAMKHLMRSTNGPRLDITVPEDLQQSLRSSYCAANELLRHFWTCFPTVDPSLESKLVRVHETLKKFESNKLQPMSDSFARDQRNLLNHLRCQFKVASRKYDGWKIKQSARG